jgi:putative transposase
MHYIAYHLVWPVKRNKRVLYGKIKQECKKLIEMKCCEKGWEVLDLRVEPHYVYLHVQAWPGTSAFEVIKDCKALTSHELRFRHAVLLKLPSLWTKAFFASTQEKLKDKQILGYIGLEAFRNE